jgi:nucleoid-associated protein YgaU
MFDSASRYAKLPVGSLSVIGADGTATELRYVRRRFVPSSAGMTTLAEHTVVQGDRLDNITARYLGDPTLFWRICDANDVMRPAELTDNAGRSVRVALPEA